MPLLKPHHIIQSRNIKRYFVGDLESHVRIILGVLSLFFFYLKIEYLILVMYYLYLQVKSYPIFQGLEKHYLRAHIARITAGTHVSPRDYFVYRNNNIKSYKWKKLSSFQSKAMSQKSMFFFQNN